MAPCMTTLGDVGAADEGHDVMQLGCIERFVKSQMPDGLMELIMRSRRRGEDEREHDHCSLYHQPSFSSRLDHIEASREGSNLDNQHSLLCTTRTCMQEYFLIEGTLSVQCASLKTILVRYAPDGEQQAHSARIQIDKAIDDFHELNESNVVDMVVLTRYMFSKAAPQKM